MVHCCSAFKVISTIRKDIKGKILGMKISFLESREKNTLFRIQKTSSQTKCFYIFQNHYHCTNNWCFHSRHSAKNNDTYGRGKYSPPFYFHPFCPHCQWMNSRVGKTVFSLFSLLTQVCLSELKNVVKPSASVESQK